MSIAAKCICYQSPSGICTGAGERCPYKQPEEFIGDWDDVSKSFITQETTYVNKQAMIKAIQQLQSVIAEKDKEIKDLKYQLSMMAMPAGMK